MLRRFSLVSVIFCALVIITVTADEQENIISEDLVSLFEKIGKLLKDKNYDKFRTVYPRFLNALKYWNDYELVKEQSLNNNFIENTNEDQLSTLSNDDISDTTLQFLPASWLDKDGIKRKRAYHRALCHFKLCNMGSKRSRFWNMVRSRNT